MSPDRLAGLDCRAVEHKRAVDDMGGLHGQHDDNRIGDEYSLR